MKERIIEFLRAENKSSAQMAEEIGVQPSGISHILSGRNKPSLDFVLKMLEKYQFLSTEWLLFGRGDIYKEHSMQELFIEAEDKKPEKVNSVAGLFDQSSENEIKSREEVIIDHKEGSVVEKIVWFFDDRSFKEYSPEK
ncbi:MAG: helix-turn-helix transcriptional regulator [Bacteroidales bacterium]|jgi:transcriptional regulator with XRE-family HTH domain